MECAKKKGEELTEVEGEGGSDLVTERTDDELARLLLDTLAQKEVTPESLIRGDILGEGDVDRDLDGQLLTEVDMDGVRDAKEELTEGE